MKLVKGIFGLSLIILAVAAAGFFYLQKQKAEHERDEAELQLGLDASRMINLQFQRQADLNVMALSGDVTTVTTCNGRVFNPTQRTRAPASVDYTIDLKAVGSSAFRWESNSKKLTINIPDVKPTKPNINLAAAVIRQDGIFISRTCGLVLARKTATQMTARVAAEANKPENLNKAREAAREAVSTFASSVLRGSGLSDIAVAVSFPWERKKISSTGEKWDETTPLLDVLARTRD